jgi:septal ring factor EnvC (AmiA/AmiB activator)
MNKDKIYLILISVLLLTSLIFGYKWFYSGNSASKERVKQLEAEFKELEKKKKESDTRIKYWETQFAALQAKSDSLNAEIDALEKQAKDAEVEAKKSKAKFEALSKQLAETRHKIEEFKKNPPNRTGDLLLESIKNKTK